MGTAERRSRIMSVLCRRRHETIPNLAAEFGVSTRTIQRDIDVLSITEPIYTRCGRYDGGVYVTDNYIMNNMYMTDCELLVLHKLSRLAERRETCVLNNDEMIMLRGIISQYTKPGKRKGN